MVQLSVGIEVENKIKVEYGILEEESGWRFIYIYYFCFDNSVRWCVFGFNNDTI